MQIEALRIFCSVVRLQSFSKGAEENRVTQSSASQAIHHLEEQLEVMLIDRSHRPFQLTKEGKVFYDGCKEIVDKYNHLRAKIQHIQETGHSIVYVSSIYSAGLRHIQEYVQKFSELNPDAQVHLDFFHPNEVYQSVIDERADIGIVSYPQHRRELVVIPWRNENMVLVCHPEYALADKKKLKLEDLRGERFVHFTRDLVIRKEIDRVFKHQHIDVKVEMEFDNIESIKRAVEVGSGISILPKVTLDHEIKAGSLVAIPLQSDEMVRPLALIHRKGKHFHEKLQAFIDLLMHDHQGQSLTAV